MRSLIIAACACLLLASCGGQAIEAPNSSLDPDAGKGGDSSSPGPAPASGQRILFEESYVNGAWGASIRGTYVTDEGKVYKYDYYGTKPSDGGPEPYTDLVPGMTESQVTAKHGSNPQLLTTVDQQTLLAKFALLGGARKGALLSQSSCADYGVDRYVGYLYDPDAKTYTPIPLETVGDRAVLNTAPEGPALAAWLRSVIGETAEHPCRYRTAICKGSPCPNAPPCVSGTVPMSAQDQGCLDKCGLPSQCAQVDSCSVCTSGGSKCMVDGKGGAHCLSWVQGCQQTAACDCGGNDLCAGGVPYCHGDGASGFSCSGP